MNPVQEKSVFINRELSWLEFDRRVLELANDKSVPLAEQLKFASIFASNMDEFFMVRVGSLFDQTLVKAHEKENKTKMTAAQQLEAILPRVAQLTKVSDKYTEKLYSRLSDIGYKKLSFADLGKKEENFWKKYFLEELFPVLSPQIIDKRHPFPFLRGMDTYVGVALKGKQNQGVFGIIPVSPQFDRIIWFNRDNQTHFFFVEEIIEHFAELVFQENVSEKCIFRVTRNADITVSEGMLDHDIDYREVMSDLIKKRRKLAAVRIQFNTNHLCPEFSAFLREKLVLSDSNCFYQKTPLNMSIGFAISKRLVNDGYKDLAYGEKHPILAPPKFSLANSAKKEDVLLAYPYQSIRPFIKMLQEAANDPDVVSIKMTLYRVASDSKIIEALINAAENGKEVVTIVELRARFDEQNNIDWSKELERAGCTVIYGFEDYKVHSKLTLITKKKGNRFEYISQIGTGNYNEKTAELYTDLAITTTDEQIGEEVATVFNNLAVERNTSNVEDLLVAPLCFKSVLMKEMDKEIESAKSGRKGRIIIKCNSVSDKDIIEKICEASQAGVRVDMIIRGICCIRAGVKDLTENVHIRSIVGRFLEHSRIYAFGGIDNPRVYIASGDFLTRNTQRRVEVGVKVKSKKIREKLRDILKMQLNDNVNARIMLPDGSYEKVMPMIGEDIVDSQEGLYDYLKNDFEEYVSPQSHYTKNNSKASFIDKIKALFIK